MSFRTFFAHTGVCHTNCFRTILGLTQNLYSLYVCGTFLTVQISMCMSCITVCIMVCVCSVVCAY